VTSTPPARDPRDGWVHVEVDATRCQGHNRCVIICPEVFETDEFGFSVVKLPEVGPELNEKVRLAEANCPEEAIRLASPGSR
jgi:ferredoxin